MFSKGTPSGPSLWDGLEPKVPTVVHPQLEAGALGSLLGSGVGGSLSIILHFRKTFLTKLSYSLNISISRHSICLLSGSIKSRLFRNLN